MSYGPFVPVPPGYCFIPSCPAKLSTPSSTSQTRSLTTSTTTIIGPTITASFHQSKRSAANDDDVKPMLGTHSFAAFPTDAAVPVGAGPICIVYCDWAKMQNAGETFRPAIRPASVMKSTMMSVSRATMTADAPSSSSSLSLQTSSTSITFSSAQPTSSPLLQSYHRPNRPSAGEITGIVITGLAGLALLAVVAWLITRKIRNVRAKLNKHNQGVHRDREREIYERDGGKGVPEMGGIALAEVHQKV
ncbi:MAG: hypothetical protein L6R40_001359 [Gallowayella cf. fulva]|nr:MAG: hypothetical protein L6R40_001359 [Xanthomendoza cf. fulva]